MNAFQYGLRLIRLEILLVHENAAPFSIVNVIKSLMKGATNYLFLVNLMILISNYFLHNENT